MNTQPTTLFRALLWLCFITLSMASAETRRTQNIVLVTADGLRWQEVFRGIDPLLMHEEGAGMKGAQKLRDRLWRDSPAERRALLLPFFWGELAKRGIVLGNPDKRSSVQVSNQIRVSYPGYSEILTGRAQDAVIDGNDEIQNPTETVLEVLRRKWDLEREQVALFASWSVFHFIGEHQPGTIFINAGYRDIVAPQVSPRLRQLSAMQSQLLTPWDSVRHDYFTFEMALEYLRTVKPRVLYIALGETDDWAHDRRYDRVLQTASYFDRCLAELWETIETLPAYRGKTSLVVTSDHGRGSTLEDWHGHGGKVNGAADIWLAVMGPDTAAVGEASETPTYYQRDVAPTILDLAGLDVSEMPGVEGKPIPLAIGR